MRFATSHRVWWISFGATAVLLVLLWAISTALAQSPQGDEPLTSTADNPAVESFTYQGRLLDGGQPANGVYDFRFTVLGPKEGPVGLTQVAEDQQVTDGLFTVYLGSGGLNQIFTGEARWLKIEVRPGASTGDYIVLLPYQPLTAVPYAWGLMPGATIHAGVASPSALISVTQTSIDSFGIYGSAEATGVYGRGNNTGVEGFGSQTGVRGVSGVVGVRGDGSPYGIGVYAISTYNDAVLATSQDGTAVFATSQNGTAVVAQSEAGSLIEAYDSNPYDRRFYVSNSGNVYADGAFSPGGADLADMLPAVEGLEPGDVLVINAEGKLARSNQVYQTSVAGVYSTNPGFLGGMSDDSSLSGRIPLAVAGVVPVKVTVENGPIQPGDLLTTSSTPGYAMRADPVTVNGITFYPGGTIIGKALEVLEDSTGVIRVLVMLQ